MTRIDDIQGAGHTSPYRDEFNDVEIDNVMWERVVS